LEKLIKILSPPEIPQKTGDKEQWRNFFDTLGTELPSDYVKFNGRISISNNKERFNMQCIP